MGRGYTAAPPRLERTSEDRRFVKGPLPYTWMQRAGQLPGKALHVALGLWFKKGVCGSITFTFKPKEATAFGASIDAVYDALERLEAAGLIRVERHRGRSPTVTILAASEVAAGD